MSEPDWSLYDGIETSSNRYYEEEDCWERVDDPADAKHISQHSLYLHCKEGGVECYADFPGDAMGLYMCDMLAFILLDRNEGLQVHGHVNFMIDKDKYMDEQKMEDDISRATEGLTEVSREAYMREVQLHFRSWTDTATEGPSYYATEWHNDDTGADHGQIMALALYVPDADDSPLYYLRKRPWIVWFETLEDVGIYQMHHSQWVKPRDYPTKVALIDDLIKQQNEGDFLPAMLVDMLRALTFSHCKHKRFDRGDYQ